MLQLSVRNRPTLAAAQPLSDTDAVHLQTLNAKPESPDWMNSGNTMNKITETHVLKAKASGTIHPARTRKGLRFAITTY